MTENIDPLATHIRIAKASAQRSPVDANGNPTGPTKTYHYDERGRLVDVRTEEEGGD